jgi:phage baseplate assembly protein W
MRRDYAFPFRIDPASRQAAQTGYAAHVEQMVRQVLLTAPGERADLPEFGCGLRQLLFAPQTEALEATTRIQVQGALNRWLAGQITVQTVRVISGASAAPEAQLDQGALLIEIEYLLVETQTNRQMQVQVI